MLIKNQETLHGWLRSNFAAYDARRYELYCPPLEFPCFAVLAVLDWKSEEYTPVYYYREDLKGMFE